jgi:hypothetical protein
LMKITLIYFLSYATTSSLTSGLASKQDTLSFSSPLIKTETNITINLGSYSTTGNAPNYYLKTGGTLNGNLAIPDAPNFLSFGTRNENF